MQGQSFIYKYNLTFFISDQIQVLMYYFSTSLWIIKYTQSRKKQELSHYLKLVAKSQSIINHNILSGYVHCILISLQLSAMSFPVIYYKRVCFMYICRLLWLIDEVHTIIKVNSDVMILFPKKPSINSKWKKNKRLLRQFWNIFLLVYLFYYILRLSLSKTSKWNSYVLWDWKDLVKL